MAMTTIKLESAVRDRLNELAARQGCTAGSMVERLIDEYLWRQKIEMAIRQMSGMSDVDRAAYIAEVEVWDSAAADGLDPW